ncbi:MAG: hypothetical protein LBU14_01830 [Candidatus Peribacteria bacterium]|jgi:hypothetical protein|nr:hypothetical protein [Candidatus Peribacteria bacterium]
MEEKEVDSSIEALETNDIYKCLIENRSVCSGDAASLSLLLNEIGIQSTHITIADKKDNNGVHEVVSLKIGGEDYICDPTLIRSALKDRNIPKISPRVFLFSPKDFFQIIYKQKEIKYIHTPYKL